MRDDQTHESAHMNLSTFASPIDDRWFEDYVPGETFEFGPIAVSEGEILSFARRYDPQDMHVDPRKAAEGVFGGLIASGWHTAGLMMRLAVDHYLSSVASIASPGVEELRWKAPVRPGDQLKLRVTVQDARRSASKPDRGLVTSLLEGVNQNGEVVCSMRALNLMFTRDR
jgi:acyl dehydratase